MYFMRFMQIAICIKLIVFLGTNCHAKFLIKKTISNIKTIFLITAKVNKSNKNNS